MLSPFNNKILLTNSEISFWREEWTPIINGVGVDKTSIKEAGSIGM